MQKAIFIGLALTGLVSLNLIIDDIKLFDRKNEPARIKQEKSEKFGREFELRGREAEGEIEIEDEFLRRGRGRDDINDSRHGRGSDDSLARESELRGREDKNRESEIRHQEEDDTTEVEKVG